MIRDGQFYEEKAVRNGSSINSVNHNLRSRPPVFPVHVVTWRTDTPSRASMHLLVDLCANHAFGDSQIEVGLKFEPEEPFALVFKGHCFSFFPSHCLMYP